MFADTLKFIIFRVLFALAVYFDMEIEQIDFISTYLQDELDETIYVKQFPDFEQGKRMNGNGKWKLVWKLKRDIYGLK